MKMNIIPDEVNLLYIEDDVEAAELVVKQLNRTRHTKFNITIKNTLKDGLEYIKKECISEDNSVVDVILLDLILPNSEGVDTFLRVKKAVDFIPIVIVSGHEDIAYKCVELGAQDYLVKPDISVSILIRSLKYSIKRNSIEQKMKNVIMTSSLGYHMYELKNDQLIFVGYNPAANKILGVNCKEFIGKELNEVFPDLSDEVEDHYRLALTGIPLENERVEYGNDTIKKVIFRVNAYKTAENFLTVTFEDITEKIKTEESLQETLEKYKNLIEVTGASIFGMDFVKQKFTYVNDIMCETLGYTRQELLQMWPSDYLTPKSKKIFNERIEALKQGEYIHNNVEYECIRKDGSIVWVLITTSYPDINETIYKANAVAIDITEKKMVEKALEEKEIEVFSHLEKKIHDWKEELLIKNKEQEASLKLIDAEILSLNIPNKIEVI